MNTRKKFLLQSSMATAALLVSKPFKNFASTVTRVTGYSINNKIVLAHTANNSYIADRHAVRKVAYLKKNTGNLLLLHAGKKVENNISQLQYDASLYLNNSVLNNLENYKIIYKGDIKIGIITADEKETDVIIKINTLSSYLKKEKNCQLVICLSQLGYKNKSGIDDLKLAEQSSDLDIIISGHANNFCPVAYIARNTKKEEVIIHSAADNGFGLGNIEIGFDSDQNKRSVDINNLLTRI